MKKPKPKMCKHGFVVYPVVVRDKIVWVSVPE